MLKFTLGRDAIINYIGFRHAFPVINKVTGEPWILRHGDDESQYRRVGWYEFFRAAEARKYVFVYDDAPDKLEWRWSTLEDAIKSVGPANSELATHVQQVLKGVKLEAPPAQPPNG